MIYVLNNYYIKLVDKVSMRKKHMIALCLNLVDFISIHNLFLTTEYVKPVDACL